MRFLQLQVVRGGVMRSHEALATAINRNTPDHAKALHLSTSLVNKWQEPCADFSDSGAHNPLDRIETVIETSIKMGNPLDTALSPVFFLGQRFNFIPLILPDVPANLADVSKQLNHMIKDFGLLISSSAVALEDGRISLEERRSMDVSAQHLMAALGQFMNSVAEVSR